MSQSLVHVEKLFLSLQLTNKLGCFGEYGKEATISVENSRALNLSRLGSYIRLENLPMD